MTDKYHPVTREELHQILNGYESLKMLNEVLSRPDPLALLEAWIDAHWNKCADPMNFKYQFDEMLVKLRENPEAVRQQGIKDGWWKE